MDSMAAGDRLAPERELAQRFGANRATISRAIASLVNEGLLVRRVGRGTFVAGGEMGMLRTKTRSVGLVMPYIHGVFPAGIIRSAVRSLRGQNYKTVLFDSENSVAEESAELERLMREGLDGALVMPVELPDNAPVFNRLVRLGFPLVFLDRKPLNLVGDYVATDHFGGAYEATKRLIERGHKRIAHFTVFGPRVSTSIVDRRNGYEQALKDHGMDVDPELVCPPSPFPDQRLVYKHSLAYLTRSDAPVTAVFAMNDIFALATIAACLDLGLKVPDDIEVAAFYDGNIESLVDIPILKIVQQQDEIGRQAVDLLMRRIEANGPDEPQSIAVRPQIVDELGLQRK